MLEIIRKISFVLVMVVILLHALVPHVHHSDMSKEEHSKVHHSVKDLLGVLCITFHNDLGSSDEYVGLEYNELLSRVDFSFVEFPIFQIQNKEQLQEGNQTLFSDLLFCSYQSYSYTPSGLRAPPHTYIS